MRNAFRVNRRSFLRGLGGVAIALPLLEIMTDEKVANAAPPPKRYLVMFGGQSVGADDDPQHNDLVPAAAGAYDPSQRIATQPWSKWPGVEKHISIVSGLAIPTANGGAPPAGGRPDDFHINSLGPLFSGMRSLDNDVRGPSSDQIVADAIGQTTFKSLVYRAQAAWYLSVSAPYGRDIMSYKSDGNGGVIDIPATVSPKAAFDSLFYNFAPMNDPTAAAEQDFEWRKRKSVIDLVKGNAQRLVDRLGGEDRKRLEQHLDEIRELEKRIGAQPPVASGTCQKPTDPLMDPALGGNQGVDGNGNNTYDQNLGYSGEKERALLLCDLIHMAFACDLNRSASLMLTMAQSHMSMYNVTGQATDLHEVGHNGVQGGTKAVALANGWQLSHLAYLTDKLASTPENTGTLLDSTAIVFLFEGGHGLDTATGKAASAHSTENMVALIAGHAGGLTGGKHVVAPGMHPGNVILSGMNAVGVSTNTFGEVNGQIPELFT